MTAARQQRKPHLAAIAGLTGLLVALSLCSSSSQAATTERIVVDWHTGLAIGGYDPVAFYIDGKPVAGSPDVELHYAGAIWRFRNIGNREAFATRPDVYMPRFGGYDPIGVSRGVAVAGNPTLWLIVSGRLFLFYDRHRLEMFAEDPEHFVAEAERKWPDVLGTLTP